MTEERTPSESEITYSLIPNEVIAEEEEKEKKKHVLKAPPLFKCRFTNLHCRDLDDVWWWTTNPFIYFNFDNYRTGSTSTCFAENDPAWEKSNNVIVPSFYLGKVELDLQTIASGPKIFELPLKKKSKVFEKAKVKFLFQMECFSYCEIKLNNVEFEMFSIQESGVEDETPDLYITYNGTIANGKSGDQKCKSKSSKIIRDNAAPKWVDDDLPMIELNLSWDELKREELRIDIKYAKTGFDKTVGKARLTFQTLIEEGGLTIGPKSWSIPIEFDDKVVGTLKGDITLSDLPMYCQFEEGSRLKGNEFIGEPSIKGIKTPEGYRQSRYQEVEVKEKEDEEKVQVQQE
eukprot:gene799-9049_t